MRKRLLVLGANPAWQKVLHFPRFTPGNVNRADEKLEFASGKGINFARAAACHGKAECMLVQFSGGANGARLDAALDAEPISHFSFDAGSETRCCTTCLDRASGRVTELIEPSGDAPLAAQQALLDCWREQLCNADLASICGTLPGQTSPQLYADAVRLAAEAEVPLLLDTFRDADRLLADGKEIILKINAEELTELTGEAETPAGMRTLFRRFPIRLAAITAGGADALLSDGVSLYRFAQPKLERMVNTIGCGDTASAVFASELAIGNHAADAFRIALGAAMANTQNAFCGKFIKADEARFSAAVQITETSL